MDKYKNNYIQTFYLIIVIIKLIIIIFIYSQYFKNKNKYKKNFK